MDSVPVDTDVFSFFFRRDTRSLQYDGDVQGKIRCLSFASAAELRFGAIVGGWRETRREQLEAAIDRTVILPGDNETTQWWARVKAERQRAGRPIGSEDCWIAARALKHRIPLITHNGRDYQNISGLQVLSRGS
jgi:predicted nucleic acid-binding protein